MAQGRLDDGTRRCESTHASTTWRVGDFKHLGSPLVIEVLDSFVCSQQNDGKSSGFRVQFWVAMNLFKNF